MIQRIQTVYLFLGALCGLIAMMLPMATFSVDGLPTGQLYNLWIVTENGAHSLKPWPLFATQLLSITVALVNIFMYNNRRLQMKLCWVSLGLILLWFAGELGYIYLIEDKAAQFKLGSILPVVSFILYRMAHYRIKKDDDLVKAADRIR